MSETPLTVGEEITKFFYRVRQSPLPTYLIHCAHQTQTVRKGHDLALSLACQQAVHHFLRFELVAIAIIRQVNVLRCFVSWLNDHFLGPPKLLG